MTIDEQAEIVQKKVGEIHNKLSEISRLCELILARHFIGEVTYQYTIEQKQALIAYYGELKVELKALVEELP